MKNLAGILVGLHYTYISLHQAHFQSRNTVFPSISLHLVSFLPSFCSFQYLSLICILSDLHLSIAFIFGSYERSVFSVYTSICSP